MRGQSEEMPGVGVVRIGLENLAVGILCLAKVAGLMVLEGHCQRLINICHAACSTDLLNQREKLP
jgi:hypothetical protein